MTSTLVVVEHPEDVDGVEPQRIRTAAAFLAGAACDTTAATVIVLCRSHRYRGPAYHCASVAEARGQTVIPTAAAIADLRSRQGYRHVLPELDRLLPQRPRPANRKRGPRHIDIYFGQVADSRFRRLAKRAFALFACPILRLEIRHGERRGLHIAAMRLRAVSDLATEEQPAFYAALRRMTDRPTTRPRPPGPLIYDLAMLTDPNEVLRPSSEASLRKFIQAGRELRVRVERIGKHDLARLTEFDALFIRETTRVDHHTYAFARRAAAAGMPVIDDPQSILRCTNKIFLADAMRTNGVAIPRSLAIQRSTLGRATLAAIARDIGYPAVIKIPDGSFSRGVYKAQDERELRTVAHRLFAQSAALLVQEFVPTTFDWRIGVLNRQPIYACQYFMSRNHWQVNKVMTSGRVRPGRWSTCLVADAPPTVIDAATAAANLIGDGLYGVDLKQTPDGVVVIEVNDNPSIECGSEDLCLGDELYRLVIRDFVRRIEARGALRQRGEAPRHATAVSTAVATSA
jgi:glutathione synthase/RimK-type ligase-like ATP-grasp enzyme